MANRNDITDQATGQDITEQRDSDIQLLDDKISAAIEMKNTLAIGDPKRVALSSTINHLMDARTEMHIQELKANLDSAQLAVALARISTASQDLTTEAAKMKTVTSYIKNANAVIGAATRVTNVLKNGG
jgi:hypothetical protein